MYSEHVLIIKVKLCKPFVHSIKVTEPCLYSGDSLTGFPSGPVRVNTLYFICVRHSGTFVTKHFRHLSLLVLN